MVTPAKDELAARLALSRAEGLPQSALVRLLRTHGNAANLFAAGPAGWRVCGLGSGAIAALDAAGRIDTGPDREWFCTPGRGVLAITDPEYPGLLGDLPDPPPLLFYRGRAELLAAPQLAVVGARHATAGGVDNTRHFVRLLVQAGLVITSGLARGIDGAAHRSALEAGGETVAVCGTGLDRVYPAAHRDLAAQIEDQGVLVSQFALGTPPRRQHFPSRNRIISGLSLGVLVVEAARNSGSLITARLAAEQGREVMAVPGSIHNPLSQGCHALIRDGAKLVETVADILEELPGLVAAATAQPGGRPGPPDPTRARVLAAMGFDPVAIDQLVPRTGLTPETLSSILLVLQLEGYVGPTGDGRYTRVGERS